MAGASTRWMGKLSGGGAASAWVRKTLALATIALAGSAMMAACSGGDDNPLDPPVPGTGGGGVGGSTSTGGPCQEGSERECHVTIGEHGGVLTCLDGVQQCEGMLWGPCHGTTRHIAKPASAGQPGEGQYPRPMSLDPPTDCIGNPCDPSCQVFNEDPGPGGVTITTLPPWNVGDINALPPSVFAEGNHEPCTTAEDCQFDQYCDNPARGACEHHPCAAGTGLYSTCSPCVQKICNANPSCCLQPYLGDCLHDPCTVGSPLDPVACGDPCVTSICAARPGCCTPNCTANAQCISGTCDMGTQRCTCTSTAQCAAGSTCTAGRCVSYWGAFNCVNAVNSICGKTCPAPNPWTAACAAQVGSVCGASCDVDPPCAHDKCYSGARLATACDPCVNQICTGPGGDPSCCTGAWTQACVDRVKTMCGVVCPPKGLCTSWLPAEEDPSCASADLTLGVACGGIVPVCNRGTVAAPAGIRIDRYAGSANQIPSGAPGQVLTSCNQPAGTLACTTTAPIPPGECINVNCAGLTNGMELRVNPPGAGHVSECHCENNWSIYQSATCDSPACIASASVSTIKKVTMFVWVDKSTSMSCTSGCTPACTARNATRWNPVKNALIDFFSDPESAGLGVAFRFWPDQFDPADLTTNCSSSSCPAAGTGGGNCKKPQIQPGILTDAPRPTDIHEQNLFNAINGKVACGNTPMHPALEGATTAAVTYKQANPEEEVIVVFLTDGLPSLCNTNNNQIAGLAGAAFQGYGVRTYAIGVSTDSNPTQIEQIAASGGGTAFYMDDGALLQSTLLTAMRSIRGDVLPCDISIPLQGVTNHGDVDVIWTNSSSVATTLTPVASSADCATTPNAWYFDPLDPSIAKLCPTTCATIQAEEGSNVQASVPCDSTVEPHSQTYESDCPAGSKVIWGYFTYSSVTPGDSSVDFEVRTADTTAALPAATLYPAATAHAAPTNTQVCAMGGPAPCPIALYPTLNELPDARNDVLELIMTLHPTSDGLTAPTVYNWEITYSCQDSE